MRKPLLLFCVVLMLCRSVYAQKVGLVFSGGGAKGLAHIGVLKALEENNIPIDNIVGTSMGGVVGAMYAAGYSPDEIEFIAESPEFQSWVSGKFTGDYRYFFEKKPLNPSFFSAKLQIDDNFQAKLRAGFVSDIPLNFALLELFAQASANAKNDFDKLFVPYRAMVADVLTQKTIAVGKGSLVEAVRGTITVPLLYRPVKVNERYVFDGGLYDNFPVDISRQEFDPGFIIGANVSSKTFSEYPKDNDEKLMGRFLVYMFLSKTDSTALANNGAYIEPKLDDYSVTNFTPVKEMIDEGYKATMAVMDRIKARVKERVTPEQLRARRNAFLKERKPVAFRNMVVTGASYPVRKYIERVFQKNEGELRLSTIRNGYYRLVADDNFETIYPRIVYHPESDSYDFEIQVKSAQSFRGDLGGYVSSRPVSYAYIGVQYNYINRNSYTASGNFYFGRFYESFQGTLRTDIPTRLPIYLETDFTYNFYDFFSSNQIFVEKITPVYLAQSDRHVSLKAGIPMRRNGKIEVQGGFVNNGDQYSPTETYSSGDTLDVNRFNGLKLAVSYEQNSLNRKQYATAGSHTLLQFSYFNGTEEYTQGNILRGTPNFTPGIILNRDRRWWMARASQENYFFSSKYYSVGYLAEGVMSNKPLFATYKASILTAPAFFPLQDSRTLYLENFRSNTYGALGIKNAFGLAKNLDLRLEGFIFQPFERIIRYGYQTPGFEKAFSDRYFAATAGVVFHTPVGPVSLSTNYQDDQKKRFGVLFHAGFLIFNKRALD
ncbi:MAG: patatin-like phospholipase family protein [Mucilaginibacter polytrichastri]|nr:patatin-like phospholipase family protein [Mucilaginibacter polytrichastri]